jgi:hypothetical protein
MNSNISYNNNSSGNSFYEINEEDSHISEQSNEGSFIDNASKFLTNIFNGFNNESESEGGGNTKTKKDQKIYFVDPDLLTPNTIKQMTGDDKIDNLEKLKSSLRNQNKPKFNNTKLNRAYYVSVDSENLFETALGKLIITTGKHVRPIEGDSVNDMDKVIYDLNKPVKYVALKVVNGKINQIYHDHQIDKTNDESNSLHTISEASPKSSIKKVSPKLSTIKKVSPKLSTIKKVSPKLSTIKKVSPKLSTIKKVSPKLSSIKNTSPKLPFKKVSPKLSSIKNTSPKLPFKKISPISPTKLLKYPVAKVPGVATNIVQNIPNQNLVTMPKYPQPKPQPNPKPQHYVNPISDLHELPPSDLPPELPKPVNILEDTMNKYRQHSKDHEKKIATGPQDDWKGGYIRYKHK